MTAPQSHRSSLCFRYAEAARARAVSEAVRVECDEIRRETGTDDRSATTVEQSGRTLRIEITADDVVALRAGLNTWMRLVSVAERTAQTP